jgi:GH25 family lysozyme M1 (1,4-beta-N-acetylmuramidase)
LLWGAYHFAEATNVDQQVQNLLRFAAPDPDELFCLDWEDYGSNTMSVSQAKEWITQVETALGRPNECVIYSGNTAKEMLDGADEFFGSRRLWLAQYGSTPQPQESWDSYWLWQFTDGVYGPSPIASMASVPRFQLVRRYAGRAGRTIGDWIGGTWT